jgi:hypothetical protein
VLKAQNRLTWSLAWQGRGGGGEWVTRYFSIKKLCHTAAAGPLAPQRWRCSYTKLQELSSHTITYCSTYTFHCCASVDRDTAKRDYSQVRSWTNGDVDWTGFLFDPVGCDPGVQCPRARACQWSIDLGSGVYEPAFFNLANCSQISFTEISFPPYGWINHLLRLYYSQIFEHAQWGVARFWWRNTVDSARYGWWGRHLSRKFLLEWDYLPKMIG